MRTAVVWLALAAWLGIGGRVSAQASPDSSAGADLRVYVATYGQGDEVWELFGHNAIWLQDTRSGYTLSYNWGMFSFKQPGFIPRLIRGSMLYWMQPEDAQLEADRYVAANRTITVQELDLGAAQKAELRAFLQWNDQDQNRFYEYHYFRDNCSTRVRDALDRVLGGQLGQQLRAIHSDQTFRSHSLALTARAPLTYTGIELGLADSVDHRITAWEEAFVPMELMRSLRAVRVRDAGGAARPLVREESVVFRSTRADPPARVPTRWPIYLLLGLLVGGLFAVLGRLRRRSRAAARTLAVAAGTWSLMIGFFGLLVLLLWTSTGHTFTYGNENLLQVNPLSLALVVLAPAAALQRRWSLRAASLVAASLAALSVFGLVGKLLPGFDQWNRDIIALMVPSHLGMLLALYRPRDSAASTAGDDRAARELR